MNINKNVTGLYLLLIINCFFMNSANAQQYSIKDRWNIKIGYSGYPNIGHKTAGTDISPVFLSEVNYGILKFLEIGCYTGYTSIKTISGIINNNYTATSKANTIFYGVNANVHLFPFLIKSEKFRIDIYLSCKYGGFYRFSDSNMQPERGHTFDYGVYAGTAFYLGEHWGIFGEYGIGNYTNHRFGLAFKF